MSFLGIDLDKMKAESAQTETAQILPATAPENESVTGNDEANANTGTVETPSSETESTAEAE